MSRYSPATVHDETEQSVSCDSPAGLVLQELHQDLVDRARNSGHTDQNISERLSQFHKVPFFSVTWGR